VAILYQDGARLPHDLETRYQCCLRRIESKWPIRKICAYYHVSKRSLLRWLKAFDGTRDSLLPRSHARKSKHPRETGPGAVKKMLDLRRRNPGDTVLELWLKCRLAGFGISKATAYRILERAGVKPAYVTNPKRRHDGKYHGAGEPFLKWQMDVKFVPSECKAPGLEGRFYQYTVLDEFSRRRFLWFSAEHSMYETVRALEGAIAFFGAAPRVLQTDNGSEFSDRAFRKEKSRYGRDYPNCVESFLAFVGVEHKFIRPRTPEHNGRVERSHRVDGEKFYRHLSFHSLADLRAQGARWNLRYNSMPKQVLGFKSPNEAEIEGLIRVFEETGEVRCPKSYMPKGATSSEN